MTTVEGNISNLTGKIIAVSYSKRKNSAYSVRSDIHNGMDVTIPSEATCFHAGIHMTPGSTWCFGISVSSWSQSETTVKITFASTVTGTFIVEGYALYYKNV